MKWSEIEIMNDLKAATTPKLNSFAMEFFPIRPGSRKEDTAIISGNSPPWASELGKVQKLVCFVMDLLTI